MWKKTKRLHHAPSIKFVHIPRVLKNFRHFSNHGTIKKNHTKTMEHLTFLYSIVLPSFGCGSGFSKWWSRAAPSSGHLGMPWRGGKKSPVLVAWFDDCTSTGWYRLPSFSCLIKWVLICYHGFIIYIYVCFIIFHFDVLCISFIFIWSFPNLGVPQNGWFIREHPIEMDNLGVPLFQETFILWLNQAFVTRPCARWAPHLVIGARSSSLMVEREEDITISWH